MRLLAAIRRTISSLRRPFVVQVNRRDHQALLIDLGGVGARKAGLAAEVDQVHAHRGESEQLATVVGGLDDAHVLRVLRAAIRIVDQKDIAGAHVLDPAHVLDHRPDRVGEGRTESTAAHRPGRASPPAH